MGKITLHAQASAVSIAAEQARRHAKPPPRPAAWDHIAPGLSAAFLTLSLLQAAKPETTIAEFIREIEAGE